MKIKQKKLTFAIIEANRIFLCLNAGQWGTCQTRRWQRP